MQALVLSKLGLCEGQRRKNRRDSIGLDAFERTWNCPSSACACAYVMVNGG